EPTSTSARSQLLASGEQLASRWRSMDAQMATIEGEVGARMQAQAAAANALAGEIAALNGQIAAAGSSASPDLLDQRALRVDKLVSLVGGSTVEQDDGSLNVFAPGSRSMGLGQAPVGLWTGADADRAA